VKWQNENFDLESCLKLAGEITTATLENTDTVTENGPVNGQTTPCRIDE
jgi:hypothetical protein